MIASDLDIQRRRDGAFFEDWSQWRDLGSPKLYRQCSPRTGARRVNVHAPSYHCALRERLPYDGRAGFEVAIPQKISIYRLLRAIPGAYKPPLRMGPAGNVETWYVPAESWEALRAALPAIKRIVTDMTDRIARL